MQVVTLKALTKDTSACLDRVAGGTPLLIVRYRVRMAWLLPPEVEVGADDVVSIKSIPTLKELLAHLGQVICMTCMIDSCTI